MSPVAGASPFVGRERELALLSARLQAAGAGGGVVLISGEPGIGKTRLLWEMAEQARALGWQTLAGRAYDTEGMPPYLPFVEALRPYVRACPRETLAAQLGRGAAEVALLLPDARDRFPDLADSPPLSAEYQRYRLFESVTDFILAIAQPGLLLTLDDLQWADRPALLLLVHLARRLAEGPLLIVAAFRDTDVGSGHPLNDVLVELRRERRDERIVLHGLTEGEIVALIGGRPRIGPDDFELARTLHNRTDGNPFFIEECLRHLAESGSSLGVPAGVREAIDRRAARLSERCRELLICATVLGREFDLQTLSRMAALDGDRFLAALEEAIVAGMLVETDAGGGARCAFVHDLIRETLVEGISGLRRSRLHARAAAAIEAVHTANLDPYLAALATHHRLAGREGDLEKALSYSLKAADAAAALFAWEEVASHRLAALTLVGGRDAAGPLGDDERCDLILALGDAQIRAGQNDSAPGTFMRAARLAKALGSAEQLARAALGHRASSDTPGGVNRETVELIEDALAALGPESVALRAALLTAFAGALWWTPDAARKAALCREAVTLARASGDPRILAPALDSWLFVLQGTREDEDQLALANELIRAEEEAGTHDWLVGGSIWRMQEVLRRGEIEEFDQSLAARNRLTAGFPIPDAHAITHAWQAMRALLAGSFADAEAFAGQWRAWHQRRRSDTPVHSYFLQLGVIRREQGRLAEMEDNLLAFAARHPTIPMSRMLPVYAHALLGREAEARAGLNQITEEDFNRPHSHPHRRPHSVMAAEVCAIVRDTDRAALLYRLLLPYARLNVVDFTSHVPWGAVSHSLGLLAATLSRWEEAAAHFNDAIAMHQRIGALPLLAHTRRAYATMLLRRGRRADVQRARDLLDGSVAICDTLGMAYWAEKARTLIADTRPSGITGAPLSERAAPALPDGLTRREVEILRLIAAGMTNRQIADWLVISRFTVLRHVNSILGKTGCANRTEAATYAHRHRLVE